MINLDQLGSLRSFADRSLRIREEFLTSPLGGARTLAVMSQPLRPGLRFGWVLCHSFGHEFGYLQPLEVMLARVLAAEGFYVLRYHGPGSGDSEMAAGEATLEHYVSSAADAADLLHERVPSIANVGFVGARFGGTVAALAHERSGRSALVLWEPVVRGRTFMRSLIRQAIASRVTLGAAGGSFDEMQNVMRHDGFIDLQGVPLHRDLFDDITRIDLVRDLTIPPRHSLIVQVSAATTAKQDLNRLTKRLSDLGSHSSMTFATSPDAARFGGPKFKPAGNGRKVDAQAEIGGVLASVTVEWIRNIDWTSGGFG